MTQPHLDHELAVAIDAAKAAAALILTVYESPFEVDFKARKEPVTEADRQANALLCERISAAFPQDGIIAEESYPQDPEELARVIAKERVWFIDPLDGTKEFIARNGEFAVMIGLTLGRKAVLGVVCLPVTGETAVGVIGQEAYVLDRLGHKQRLGVSSVGKLADASVLMSRSHRPAKLMQLVDKLGARRQVACGSVGVKALRIAQGRQEAYVNLHQPGGAKLWDGCAPEVIVRAAGGKVTDLQGQALDYTAPPIELVRGYVASNGWLHDELIGVTSAYASGS